MRDRRRHARRKRDRGSVAVEVTMLVWPVAVIMAAFIAGGWVLAVARHDVNAAAAAAARAASQQYSPAAATEAATATAQTALAESGRACSELSVAVDTSQFRHGGQVEVTVQCRADLADLAGLEIPGAVDLEASSRAPIDTYRELEVP